MDMQVERMARFLQSVDDKVYEELKAIANERGISVQELIRAVIIPEWMTARKTKPSTTEKYRA